MPKVRYRCDRCGRRRSFVRLLSGHDTICEKCGGTLQRCGAAHRIGCLARRLPAVRLWIKLTAVAVLLAVATAAVLLTVLEPSHTFGTLEEVAAWMKQHKLWLVTQEAETGILRGRTLDKLVFAPDATIEDARAEVFVEAGTDRVCGVSFTGRDWRTIQLEQRADIIQMAASVSGEHPLMIERITQQALASALLMQAATEFCSDFLSADAVSGISIDNPLFDFREVKEWGGDEWRSLRRLPNGVIDFHYIGRAYTDAEWQAEVVRVFKVHPVSAVHEVWGGLWLMIFRDTSWD